MPTKKKAIELSDAFKTNFEQFENKLILADK